MRKIINLPNIVMPADDFKQLSTLAALSLAIVAANDANVSISQQIGDDYADDFFFAMHEAVGFSNNVAPLLEAEGVEVGELTDWFTNPTLVTPNYVSLLVLNDPDDEDGIDYNVVVISE